MNLPITSILLALGTAWIALVAAPAVEAQIGGLVPGEGKLGFRVVGEVE